MKLLILASLFASIQAHAFEASATSAVQSAAISYLSHVTSSHPEKEIVVRNAEEDAAAFLAGGEKTAILAEAMDYVRDLLANNGFQQPLTEGDLAVLVIERARY